MGGDIKKDLLKLYYLILKRHSAILPKPLIKVSNAHLKSEFKAHFTAGPKHLQPFINQWAEYCLMIYKANDFGEVVKSQEGQSAPEFSKEQQDLLDMIKKTVVKS